MHASSRVVEMAYNGTYGSYSPYFNPQQGDSNERSQFSYQNTSGSNGGYQRQTYAAPNASISNQQQPQSSQNAYGSTARYTNLEGQAHPGYQSQRNEYTYPSGTHTAGDTSALGNLAYASTLRSSGDNAQRVGDYNRAASAGGYDQTQGQVDGQNIQRTDSRGSRATSGINSPNTSAQSYPATASQQNFGQQSQQSQQYTAYPSNYGGFQSSAYPHSQPMRHEVSDTRRASYQATAPPSRPASGQSTHASRVRSNQANQSPQPDTYTQPPSVPAPSQAQAPTTPSYKPSGPAVPAPISRPQSTQKARPQSSNTSSIATNPNPSGADSPRKSHSLSQSSTSKKIAAPSRSKPQSTQLPHVKHSTPVQNTEPQTTAVQHQHPTTVNPNQIFNQYEYEKRQAEAEAAKRKAAADAEEAKKAAEAMKQAQLTAQKNVVNGASINGEDDEARKKEQMEAEMKLMLEKMREYKSKDPALFSQIWETVKKAQPPTSSKDSTQAPAAELPASKEVALPSPQVPTVQSPTTIPVISTATENSTENGELDRGKFPAARRGRPGRKSRGGRSSLPAITHVDSHNETLKGDTEASAPSNTAQDFDRSAVTPQTDKPFSKQPVQKVWVAGKKPLKSAMKSASRKITSPPSTIAQPSGETPSAADFDLSDSAPTASGQTLWPEEDKWNLASAARDTLLSNLKNEGKYISSTEIHNILNQGPSYEELCKILEAKGFVVDRTPFAQQLLAAVPKLKEDPPQRSTPQSSTTWQATDNGASNNVAPTAPMFANLAPGRDWQTHTYEHSATKKDKVARRKKTKPGDQSSPNFSAAQQTPNGSIDAATQEPAEPPPLSKQQQARKRSFGEIVDLTAEMSSDEELKRQRAQELEKIEELKHMQQVKAAMEAAMTSKANAKASASPQDRNDPIWKSKGIRLSPGAGAGLSSSAAASDDDAVSGLSRFKSHSTPIGERLRKSRDVVKPMNGRADALRRSTYNSKTIARDVLVAAGKHPTMSALNYHLDPLRSSFRHVDYGSDLGTFNWDLIDPGGPPVKPRIVEQEQLPPQDDVNDADDEEVEEVDQSITQGSQSIQARRSRPAVTNLNSGVEDVVMLDAAPSRLIKGLFPAGPSPSPGRGRGRGRGRRPRPSRGGLSRASFGDAAGRSPGQPQISPSQIPRDNDVSMLGAGMTWIAPMTSASYQPATPSATPVNRSQPQASSNPADSGKKRRGRPPKNRTPTTSLVTGDSTTPLSVPSRPLLAESTAPATTPSPAAARSPAAAPSLSNENIPASNLAPSSTMPESRVTGTPSFSRTATTPARPSGLRNQIITSPFAVVIQRSPNTNESTPRQAKTKQVKSSLAPLPKYQVYRCRWKDCEGKLHNLETLRKHIRNHLSEFDDDLKCLWQDCGTTNVGSSTGERQPLTFKSETAWERHMDGRHLDRYAWDLGDGPSPHPSG